MGEVIRFIPKSELERARLVRETRAIYESIFPPAVCTENSNPNVVMVKPPEDWV